MPLFQNESKVRNLTYEREFDLHENEPVGGTHFHMNGFALRLVLKQRQKGTRKWPILLSSIKCFLKSRQRIFHSVINILGFTSVITCEVFLFCSYC